MTNIQNQSFAIANPYVKFAICKEAFDNFAQQYNRDRELSKRLRSPHYELFYKIVRFYISRLDSDKKLFGNGSIISMNSNDIPTLRTNNTKLAKELKRNNATIYRQIIRLVDAGVILEKIFHGSNHDFELLINPKFLLIFDVNNPKYVPNTEFLTNSYSADNHGNCKTSKSSKIANCNHNQNILETINNKIILLKSIPTNRDGLKETENTEKITGSTEASGRVTSAEREYSARLRAADARFDHLKKRYAQLLFANALDNIWGGYNIYDTEKERALQYVTKNYFEHCKNEASLFHTFSEFKWRVEAAGRFLKRQDHFELHIFPTHFFDLNNKNGFIGTKKWFNDHLFRVQTKLKQREKLSDDMKLANMMRIYTKNPTYATYQSCQAYIQDNIPHMMTKFLQSLIPISA